MALRPTGLEARAGTTNNEEKCDATINFAGGVSRAAALGDCTGAGSRRSGRWRAGLADRRCRGGFGCCGFVDGLGHDIPAGGRSPRRHWVGRVNVRCERGDGVLSAAILIGSVLIAVLLVFQVGLIAHGNNLANSAARQAAERASAFDGDVGAAQADGLAFAESSVWDGSPSVSVSRGDEETTVSVQGQVQGIGIFALPWNSVTVEVIVPTERFVPLDEAG